MINRRILFIDSKSLNKIKPAAVIKILKWFNIECFVLTNSHSDHYITQDIINTMRYIMIVNPTEDIRWCYIGKEIVINNHSVKSIFSFIKIRKAFSVQISASERDVYKKINSTTYFRKKF